MAFRLPAIRGVEDVARDQRHGIRDALRHRHVLFGVMAIFFYVGAEVSIGSVLVNYLSMPHIGQGLTEQQATTYVSMYWRSEEHTSELQSLMRISYAVFCLKNKTKKK